MTPEAKKKDGQVPPPRETPAFTQHGVRPPVSPKLDVTLQAMARMDREMKRLDGRQQAIVLAWFTQAYPWPPAATTKEVQ